MSEPQMPKPACDILLPVYNGLSYVIDALESVLECTPANRYRLLLIDDGSDAETAGLLDDYAARNGNVRVLRQPENRGFVAACNLGYQHSDAPFLLLLNSDVVVTPGWLERLLACAASDARIASVNPLTNHASQLVVPMPAGANYLGLDAVLRARPPSYPDVVTGVGFCMLLRRSALAEVGFFDPVFGRGYCEDSDLCMRLTTNGYRTVVADDVYVYHRGSGTFGGERGPRYLANRRIFDERWLDTYRRQFAAFQQIDPLREVRALVSGKTIWDPLPVVWETGRAILKATRQAQPITALKAGAHGLLRLRQARRPKPDPTAVARFTRPGRLRVTYILHRLVVAGGVLSVIQIVNALIRLGVEARIATLFEDPAVYRWTRLYTKPIVFRDPDELCRAFPESDIVVATLWTTAPWARALLDRGRAKIGVYFLQDYEPWFFPADDAKARAQVQSTFALLDHRIVKSDWLAGMLQADGYATKKILIGMDLARFYPRDVARGAPTLLAMARPRTPRRGFPTLIEALTLVKRARPDIEVHLFGDSALHKHGIPFAYQDHGIIADQERMAQCFSMADIFIDASDFQGFGRCGLEAMACGAACVLTNAGGVNEYAIHDHNAILVPPRDPEAISKAVLALLDDPEQHRRLIAAGRQTVSAFCHRREARETLDYFRALAAGEAAG